jgi:hypothetical protein
MLSSPISVSDWIASAIAIAACLTAVACVVRHATRNLSL